MNTSKKLSIISYGITACIFLVIALWGMFGSITGNEMGYCILNFYLIMPITSLIIGIIMGIKGTYLKWLYPILFGICGFIIPCLVFGFGSFDMIAVFFSFIPALLGVFIGFIIGKVRGRK